MLSYVDVVPNETTRTTVVLVYWGIRGGGARYTYEVARALAESGDRNVVVSLNAANELLPLFRELAPRVAVDRRAFGGSPRSRAKAWLGLIPGPWSFGSWCRRTAGRDARVIVTMGNPLSLPMALTLRAARMSFTHVVHDARPHPGENSRLMVTSIRWAARLASSLVALSENVRAQMIDSWGVETTRITIIPHGPFYAKEAKVARSRAGERTSPTGSNVLFLGRIAEYKGIGLLLDAWSLVTGPDARLTIAGHGDLSPWAGQLKTATNVVTDNRWLSDADIVRHISSADVLVLPYLEASQSGVIGIAHSFGVPVVCTDVGGLADQADPANGDIVVEGAAQAIVTAVEEVLARPTRMTKVELVDSWIDIAESLVHLSEPATRS